MINLFQFFDANAFQLVSLGLIVYLWKRQEKINDSLNKLIGVLEAERALREV